jgi:hypothetical protein
MNWVYWLAMLKDYVQGFTQTEVINRRVEWFLTVLFAIYILNVSFLKLISWLLKWIKNIFWTYGFLALLKWLKPQLKLRPLKRRFKQKTAELNDLKDEIEKVQEQITKKKKKKREYLVDNETSISEKMH